MLSSPRNPTRCGIFVPHSPPDASDAESRSARYAGASAPFHLVPFVKSSVSLMDADEKRTNSSAGLARSPALQVGRKQRTMFERRAIFKEK